jgi:hypothetical protein
MINIFANSQVPDMLVAGSGVDQQPCNVNDGSSFLRIAYSRITGSLFTGRKFASSARFRSAPLEQTVHWRQFPHRVEQSSPEKSKKGNSVASLPPFLFLPSVVTISNIYPQFAGRISYV